MRARLNHRRLAVELGSKSISLGRRAQILGLSKVHLSDLANGKRLQGLGLDFEDLIEVETPPARAPAEV